jgi:hypothetical protein
MVFEMDTLEDKTHIPKISTEREKMADHPPHPAARRLSGSEVVTFCHGLKLTAPDRKLRETDYANTEGVFRIIQSIPSPRVEPFKRWIAKVGYERVQEIEDPELATKRTRAIYKAKGYSEFSISEGCCFMSCRYGRKLAGC